MDLKAKTFREKLTEENNNIFLSIQEALKTEENVMMGMEITNEKKGEISITGYGFSAIFRDKNYVKELEVYEILLPAIVSKVRIIDGFGYVTVFLPYPWLPDRDPMENPLIEQEVPNLEVAVSEEQEFEASIVGLKHHATEKDLNTMREMEEKEESVILQVEPDNEYDPFAVSVHLLDGKKVGYVKSENAPALSEMIQKGKELKAKIKYVDYDGKFAEIKVRVKCNESLELKNLFSHYVPQEVYKAMFMKRRWSYTWEDEEDQLLDPDEMRINFDYLLSLPINTQNRIAAKCQEALKKVTIENPTNPGFLMNIPLDLSIYGTSWKEIDLIVNSALLQLIERENMIVALFIRYSRTMGTALSVNQFMEDTEITISSETLLARLNEMFDNNLR